MEHPEKSNATQFLTPAVIIQIIKKRRWFIIIPLIIALVVGSGLAILLPKKYQAQTLILIEGQRVPTEYVQSLVTEDIDARINTLSQQILSRTNLEKIIGEFNLYQGPDYEDMYLEDKVNALRRNITIDITADRRRSGANAFQISYKGTDPQRVVNITNSLASYFIDENLKVREAQATGTSNFLDEELKIMRKRLEDQEQAVKNFRSENMGLLPEQLETNLRILDRLQEELTGRQEGLREAKTRLAALQNQPAALPASSQGPSAGPVGIDQLKAELARMQTRYTEKHPDIVKLKQRIKDMEANPPASGNASPATNPFVTEARIEIAGLQADIANIQSQIREYGRRVEATPGREQEFLGLQRDYHNLKESYSSLLNRQLEAEIAVNMERKQKGEQFRIIDSASLPNRPVEPDMKKLFLGTIFAGLAIACAFIFALEFLDKPFRSIEELKSVTGLPTLAMLPMIETGKQKFIKKLNLAMTGISIAITFVMLLFFTALTIRGQESIIDLMSKIKTTILN